MKNTIRNSIVLLPLLSILLLSCNSKQGGSICVKEVDGVVLELKLLKAEDIIKRQSRSNGITELNQDSMKSIINQMNYFVFNIYLKESNTSFLRYGVDNNAQYAQRLNYFSYELKDDLSVQCKDKTILPSLYVFDRSYELSKFSKSMVAFEKCNSNSLSIKFDGTQIGVGIVYFNF